MSDLTGKPTVWKPLKETAVVDGIEGRVIAEKPMTGEVTISLDGGVE